MQSEVFVLVLVPRGQEFLEKNIFGRTVDEWVKQAMLELPSKRVQVGSGDDILTIVKRHGMHHKWTAVIYADMPLVLPECLGEAVSFATTGEHKVVRLPRGWLFDTEYIKDGGEIVPIVFEHANHDHFLSVFNAAQLDRARKLMQHRINIGHMENGVEIEDIDSTFIDATVDIAPTARILPFTKITGKVKIEPAAIIGPFAHIRDDDKPVKKEEPAPPVPKPALKKLEVEIPVSTPKPKKPAPPPEPEPEPIIKEVPKEEAVEIVEVAEEPEPEDEISAEEAHDDVFEEIIEIEEELEPEEDPTVSVKFDWDNMRHDSLYEGRD